MSLRNVNLAKIHIAKAQLGLDDDAYRALLARVAGVRSSKELNPRQVAAVLAEFQRLGWKAKPATQGRAKPRVAMDRKAVLGKIEALLADAGRPWAYADGMARHMFQRERLEFLTAAELYRVMQALILDADRRKRG